MTHRLKPCTNCGVENTMENSFCSSCNHKFTSTEFVRESPSKPFSSQTFSPSRQKKARLTRRNVIIGLGGASLLAIVSPLFVSHRQEVTIATISTQHTFLPGLAWSPDGEKLVACDDTGTLRIWNIANNPLIFSRDILSVNVAERGIIQTFAQSDGTIGGVNAMAWSPNGEYIAIASDRASIMDATTGTLVRILWAAKNNNNENIAQIAWSPDGRYLATATSNGTNQKGNTRIQIWATNGWTEVKQLAGEYDICSSMAWDRTSKLLLIAGDISTNPMLQSNVQIWDVEATPPLFLQKANSTAGAAVWSPDGHSFAADTGEKNGSVLRVYNIAGASQATYASSDQSPLVAMIWSPSNHIAAVFGPSMEDASMTIYQWNTSNGQLLSASTASENADTGGWDQFQFVWSPDGTQVAYREVSCLRIWRPGWSLLHFD